VFYFQVWIRPASKRKAHRSKLGSVDKAWRGLSLYKSKEIDGKRKEIDKAELSKENLLIFLYFLLPPPSLRKYTLGPKTDK
jgi:hypothetical protein